ncbi:DNA-3-methyladenine glycosylase I [Mucisphaera sp.]|uniref:DNA-3-methyladenine glycosylase I n=1 Tax=Mucisphaera sp. TaxID=2913024 RepID=UPI003D0FE210
MSQKKPERVRCGWAAVEPEVSYHDEEWGRPVRDDRHLFEMLILEGAQAGLSWRTILTKRARYRQVFGGFEPEIVANFSDSTLNDLKYDAGIVRNRLKIASARTNSRVFLDIQAERGSFAKYLWDWVDGKPVVTRWASYRDCPAKTELSDRISKDLKKRGMSFVGSTIIYAYLQAVGVVDDHEAGCWCAE